MAEKRILAIGVFDLFHVGHLRYLEYAKQQGTYLSVAVTSDAITRAIKHKQPIVQEQQRLEIIRALRCVDEAWLQPASTEHTAEAAMWIAQWGVEHVVAGGGWQGSPRWGRLLPILAHKGISVSFAPTTAGLSTTQLVASIRQNTNPTS